jgi:ABC-type lipoprotein export system ATPase subunit
VTSVVEARDLFCLYAAPAGAVAALRGLSLAVGDRERLLVHGPNGSGKTTLLRVLAGEQPPSAGRVTVAGVDLVGAAGADLDRLRGERLGLVDQHTRRTLRPELDVLDNVALQLRLAGTGRAPARARAREVLGLLGLDHLALRDPTTLSGGEAQRVAVAAALAHRPALVLADEPTGELDPTAADRVYELLARSVSDLGAALVVVSHDPRAARIADRVVRIRDGRLSEQWSPLAPEREGLVVDDRGWLRLPESARRVAGSLVHVDTDRDRITLVGTGSAAASADADAAVTSAAAPAADGQVLAQLAGVTVRYGERTVLEGLDLQVRAGRLSVVSGRSGSGKSTLLRALCGLSPVDGGEVELFGQDLAASDRAARAALRRSQVAVAGQNAGLVETMDVGENLQLARTLRGLPAGPERLAELLDELDLAPLRHRPVRLLSGGERQRVAVARTLVVDPLLAVLDEPTSQLDETHAALVAGSLSAAARRGVGVVVATHDPAVLRVADDVLALDRAAPATAPVPA